MSGLTRAVAAWLAVCAGPLAAQQEEAQHEPGVDASPVAEASPDAAPLPVTQAEKPDSAFGTEASGTRACIIPKLTEISIAIHDDLSSGTSLAGEHFTISLASPIVIDGIEAVPVGTRGMGEVIHAKKRGGSGAAGELILAASYLETTNGRLPLRSMKLRAEGESNVNTVGTLAVASAAAAPPVALIGFLIKGGDVTVTSGTNADARTAADFETGFCSPPAVEADVIGIEVFPAGDAVPDVEGEEDE